VFGQTNRLATPESAGWLHFPDSRPRAANAVKMRIPLPWASTAPLP